MRPNGYSEVVDMVDRSVEPILLLLSGLAIRIRPIESSEIKVSTSNGR